VRTSFLLSVITIGIYGILWGYYLCTDLDKAYPEMHSSEDSVLNIARTVHGGS
jgi:hypothetical protein